MKIPTFENWVSSGDQFKVDAIVLCNLGEIQTIKDCTLYFSTFTRQPFYTKNGYKVEDYFFVEEILFIENLRKV
tara:strand:+ start:14366 stop:14587 length:222 start_codon:yes stop_codon:yes gene_type:complete